MRKAFAIAGYGEEVKIAASTDHQYYVTAAVNAAPASFLIDTGASYVALRDSDARRAGIYTTHSDFRHPVRTANGETKAALIDIREIEIDGKTYSAGSCIYIEKNTPYGPTRAPKGGKVLRYAEAGIGK